MPKVAASAVKSALPSVDPSSADVKPGALSKGKTSAQPTLDPAQLENVALTATTYSPRATRASQATLSSALSNSSAPLVKSNASIPAKSSGTFMPAKSVMVPPAKSTASKALTKSNASKTPANLTASIPAISKAAKAAEPAKPSGSSKTAVKHLPAESFAPAAALPASDETGHPLKKASQVGPHHDSGPCNESSDEEISHSAARSLLDRHRKAPPSAPVSKRKGKKRARIEESSPIVIGAPDIIDEFDDIADLVYGRDPSPSPVTLPQLTASSSKSALPLKSAMKPTPAPPSPITRVVKETPFGEILVLQDGGVVPDTFFSEWERHIKVLMEGRMMGIAPEQWNDYQDFLRMVDQFGRVGVPVSSIPSTGEPNPSDGSKLKVPPFPGARQGQSGDKEILPEVVSHQDPGTEVPTVCHASQWILRILLITEDTPDPGLPIWFLLIPWDVAAIHAPLPQPVVIGLHAPLQGTITGAALRCETIVTFLHGTVTELLCEIVTIVAPCPEISIAMGLQSVGPSVDRGTSLLFRHQMQFRSGWLTTPETLPLTFVGFLEAAPLMVKAIQSFYVPHGRSRTGSSLALEYAAEYESIFEYVQCHEDVQKQWPSYNEYLSTVMRHDLRSRAEGFSCDIGTFDDKLFTSIAWSHVRQDASDTRALSSLSQSKPVAKTAQQPSFRTKKMSAKQPTLLDLVHKAATSDVCQENEDLD
ncbi:hypothetical protein C8J56DRAFT_890835 [Mycena floridula]|nr:hypothetical protein C8J56DRAFT_890835 [Mycena floridula]